MKILVTGSRPGSGATVAKLLQSAGHTLTYCHQSANEAPRCMGVGGAGCPLAGGDVDVVVDARAEASAMTTREFGTLCALQHGTPLVIAGPVPDHRRFPWRDADVLCVAEDVVAGCNVARSPISATARRAVTAAAVRTLKQCGASNGLEISLRPRHGEVDVFIDSDRPVAPIAREAIRTVVRAALAPYTDNWAYTQVYFSR